MTGKLINSKREGVWKEYITSDNRLDIKWTFKNDLKDGIYFGYTYTGKIETVGHYRNDQLSGVLVYFDLKKKPEKVQIWKGLKDNEGASVLVFEEKLK
jgi:antitoxin component YwqK of YwqJK toxin-antitoxin module